MPGKAPPTDDRIFEALAVELLERIPTFMSKWKSLGEGDSGRSLVEIFAALAEALMKSADALSDRAFLDFARLLGIEPGPAVPAKVKLRFLFDADVEPGLVIEPGLQVSTSSGHVVFETIEPIVAKRRRDVAAVEGRRIVDETLGVSRGRSRERFSLDHGPILMVVGDSGKSLSYIPEIELSTHEQGRWLRWALVTDLQFSKPTSRDYALDVESGEIRFGDGQNGRIPPRGAKITATYRVGGGVRGNVPARRLTQVVRSLPGIVSVTNPAASDGGADRESVESVRRRAPAELRQRNRTLTCAKLSSRSGRSRSKQARGT